VLEVKAFHRSMGHIHRDALSKTTAYYGVKLWGKLEPCYECSLAKIRRMNLCKETKSKSTVPGERLLMDISSVRADSLGGASSGYLLWMTSRINAGVFL
jgi:hypothetical protein